MTFSLGFSTSAVAPVATRGDELVAVALLGPVLVRVEGRVVVVGRYVSLKKVHHVMQALGELRHLLI